MARTHPGSIKKKPPIEPCNGTGPYAQTPTKSTEHKNEGIIDFIYSDTGSNNPGSLSRISHTQHKKSPIHLHLNRQIQTQHRLPRPHRTVPNAIHPRKWIHTHRLPLRLELHHSAPSKKMNGASPNYSMEKPTSYIHQNRNCTQSMGYGQRNIVRTKDFIWTQQYIVSAGSTKPTPQKPRWTRDSNLQKSPQGRVSYYGPKITLSEWDWLIQQANITLNLLRTARVNPKLSAYDFRATPLAPPIMRVIAHINPSNRKKSELNREAGWYVGPAMEHYRCVTWYFPRTRTTRYVKR